MKDKIKIMIVEDEEILARNIKENLSEIGYEVLETVSSGEQAIIQAEKQRPDLILMDIILLGKIDGLEAAKEIFSRLDIPIVYITALGDDKTLQSAKVTEPYGYIIKPFRVEDLRITIEIAIYKYQIGKKLRENEKLLSNILSASPIGIGVIKNRKLSWSNENMMKIFGVRHKEDYIGKDSRILYVSDEEYKRVGKIISKSPKDKVIKMDAKLKRQDGSIFDGHIMISFLDPSNPNNGAVATISDISWRKKAEKALQESEDKLNTLLNATTEVAFLVESDGTLLAVNDALAKNLGREKAELVGKSIFEFFPVEVVERRMTILQKIVGSKKSYHGEDESAGKYFENSAYPILDKYGKVKQIAVFAKDITERKKAEKELQESEKKFRELINTSIEGIISIDSQMKIILWNPGAEKIFGYTEKEMLGQNLTKIIPERYRKAEEKGFLEFRKTGLGPVIGKTLELEGLRKDGLVIPVELSVSSRNAGGYYIATAIVRDIKKRKEMERQLLRSERLASIGELATSLAHEIRNPLGNISFAAQLCLSKNKIDKQTKQYLDIVLTESGSANIIIKKLLDFANPRDISLKLENIHNVIDNAINLVSTRLLVSDIRINKKYSKKLPGILLDKRWIEQCFGNFFLNAIEAMPDGGEIIISTQLDLENNEIIVVFLDKGIGIPKENLEKIFNPFFTTKEEGVGLGLSLVHQVIQNHNGKINLESQIGKGTKVIITFPIKEKNKT
jgi:PAS domain S-box-containing protein